MNGLDFVYGDLAAHRAGRCAACHQELPPPAQRHRTFTCNDACHARWVEALVQQFGETREITDATTGAVYLIPTRVILETGISAADLPTYPRKPAA